MLAYDIKRKRVVEVKRITESGAIAVYTVLNVPGEAGKWYFPLIDENGENVEPYGILEYEQLRMDI